MTLQTLACYHRHARSTRPRAVDDARTLIFAVHASDFAPDSHALLRNRTRIAALYRRLTNRQKVAAPPPRVRASFASTGLQFIVAVACFTPQKKRLSLAELALATTVDPRAALSPARRPVVALKALVCSSQGVATTCTLPSTGTPLLQTRCETDATPSNLLPHREDSAEEVDIVLRGLLEAVVDVDREMAKLRSYRISTAHYGTAG